MESAQSTRFEIVKTSLADIIARLADVPVTDEVRELRKRAARYERMVSSWAAQAPSEDERSTVMSEVLDLNMAVMKLASNDT